nr:hypothetical protein [Tanacetum cinerariifolium]
MDLEKDFVGFALQEIEIHPLMFPIRTLSMIRQMFSPTLHNTSTIQTHVLENTENMDSYYSNLHEPALLVTPLFDVNEDECFDPGGDIDKIDAFLDIDTSTDFKDDYYDSEGDILY